MSDKTIVMREHRADFAAQLQEMGYHPLATRVLASRNFTSADAIAPAMPDLAVAADSAAGRAAQLVADAIGANERICVIGDYDADGVCATALAKLALDSLEAEADWLVSHPDYEERSLDPKLVDEASAQGAKLIITVDGGVSAHAGMARARELGLRVVVTDHHPPEGGKAVEADAVVDPHLEGSGLPAQGLCGTVVAYILFKEVYRLRAAAQKIDRYLDLAAVATMTDVMPLDSAVNRGIVIAGIDRIRKRRCLPALQAILGRNLDDCPFRDLNYRIGPMLNSARRMGRTKVAVEALLARDVGTARSFINELKATNMERRQSSQKMLHEARKALEGAEDLTAIVLHDSNWNAGLVGITASQLASSFNVPAAILCTDEIATRGSMRSTAAVPLDEVMEAVSKEDPDLIARWGGHRAAAGVRLNGTVERFRELFAAACAKYGSVASRGELKVDAEPGLAELKDGSIAQLDDLPWGKEEMPAPLFVNTFTLNSCRPTKAGNGFNYRLDLEGQEIAGWGRDDLGRGGAQVRLVYNAGLDSRSDDDLPFINTRQVLPL